MSAAYTTEALTVVIERMERVIRSHGPMGFDEMRASICRPADMVHAALLLAGEQGRLMRARAGSGRICIPVPVEPRRAPKRVALAPKAGARAKMLEALGKLTRPASSRQIAAATGLGHVHVQSDLPALVRDGRAASVKLGRFTCYMLAGSDLAAAMSAVPALSAGEMRVLSALAEASGEASESEATEGGKNQYVRSAFAGLVARGMVTVSEGGRGSRRCRMTSAGREAFAVVSSLVPA